MSLAGNLPLTEVAEIEGLALQAWPGLETERVDGWLLRHAAGVTRRANSVWPNEAGGDLDLETKLTRVEAFYHARDLPARFQICPAAQPAGLDARLNERGYRAVARTAVQTTTVAGLLANLGEPSSLRVEVTAQPSVRWWACYAAADDVPTASVAARRAICDGIQLATAYAMVLREGEVIAVGSATAGDGWVGFFNIATLPQFRRMGAAQSVMGALGQWGQRVGATDAYLQVMAGNEAALRLYAKLSFTPGYYYHYREELRG
jgi:ribosomal protein S18 acetylase RimI-like enzyme